MLSGVLAAAVAVILTVQNPLVTPDFALKETIVVLVGVVVGGIDRLWTATLGGFAIGFATGVINGALPTDKTVFLPSVVFALVILVLLLRPAGLFARGSGAPSWSAYEPPRSSRPSQLLGPAVVVAVVGFAATLVSRANEIYFLNALVSVAIVVAIYVFVGNSGVLSFGQISFVAVGAFAAGVLTVPLESKPACCRTSSRSCATTRSGTSLSLALAAAVGGVLALVVGLPLMRLSGLAAGIATFAVLEITHNLLREWTKIGPGATTLSLVPETTGALQATLGALLVVAVAFAYQRSRLGRLLRATREDPAAAQAVGVGVHAPAAVGVHALGRLCGFAGGLLRAHARLDHDRAGLSRADVRHARDARRRRADEPLGRRRGRARGQRARLVPRQGGGGVDFGHARPADRNAGSSSWVR